MFGIFKNKNPVINSPKDITSKLIADIIDNKIKTLTINYEFTRRRVLDEHLYSYNEYRKRYNPFYLANLTKPLKRIEFEIILGPKVKSLAYAFGGYDNLMAGSSGIMPIDNFSELEFINLKNISKITNLSGVFYCASSFNQDISNWDVSNVTDFSDMFCHATSFNHSLDKWV